MGHLRTGDLLTYMMRTNTEDNRVTLPIYCSYTERYSDTWVDEKKPFVVQLIKNQNSIIERESIDFGSFERVFLGVGLRKNFSPDVILSGSPFRTFWYTQDKSLISTLTGVSANLVLGLRVHNWRKYVELKNIYEITKVTL